MNKLDYFVLGMFTGAFITIISVFISAIIITKPSALDVYRNKTTLEITYKDSIPVDSIVVFK